MTAKPAFPKLAQAYHALDAALAEIEPEGDRRVARDALRDALDRARSPNWRHAGILADTFAIEATIHEGPAFMLHRLRHRDLGTRHVLKTIRDARRHEPVLREMLLREGAHMLRLSHPAILTARTVLRLADGRPGLLLDHVDGATLADRLDHGPLSTSEIEALSLRLLDGLAAIHAAGLLHLDLTPANILLPDGRIDAALICDFGLSLAIGDCHRSQELVYAASAAYAGPEQLAATVDLDERADLYSLGQTIRASFANSQNDSLNAWCARLVEPERSLRPANAYEATRLLRDAIVRESALS